MSYTPNTWATGDTITAEKLNNMEQGIESAGSGGLHITLDVETDEQGNNTYSNPSHTWEQILSAYNSGAYMFLTLNLDSTPVFFPSYVEAGGPYPVYTISFRSAEDTVITFDADGEIQ